MDKITVKAFAKINLSIDVLERLETGYHEVEMVMQLVELHDTVHIKWSPNEPCSITLDINDNELPRDKRNLAYKAAEIMLEKTGKKQGAIEIYIEKNIPIAAGLAGGSSDAAAVINGLNEIWKQNFNIEELCAIGEELGSDIPFCILAGAGANANIHPIATEKLQPELCARAYGTGTKLEPLKASLKAYILLSKPNLGVSTKEVYQGLDLSKIVRRPNTKELIQALAEKNIKKTTKNMINVLEIYTLNRYDKVMYTKNTMEQKEGAIKVLMSGSGPTVFAVYDDEKLCNRAFEELKGINGETFFTQTLLEKD